MSAGFNHAAQSFFRDLKVPDTGTGGGTITTDQIDLSELVRLNIFLRQYCPSTGGSPGISVKQQYGMTAPADLNVSGGIIWAQQEDVVPSAVFTPGPTGNDASPQTLFYEWNIDLSVLPQFLRFIITNTDTVATFVDVLGDVM